jgi:hypothetical protein
MGMPSALVMETFGRAAAKIRSRFVPDAEGE